MIICHPHDDVIPHPTDYAAIGIENPFCMSVACFHEFLEDSNIDKEDFAQPVSTLWEMTNFEGGTVKEVEKELGVSVSDSMLERFQFMEMCVSELAQCIVWQ